MPSTALQHDISLKRRIFLPLSLAAILVFTLSMFALDRLQDRQWAETTSDTRKLLQHNLEMMRQDHIELMQSLMHNIASDPHILRALAARDRDALLRLCAAPFAQMKQANGITHFYFHAPDMHNILRVHQPERFGDSIERFTAKQAASSGAVSSGMELGPLGTFTLRVVSPLFEDGRLLGYIELGAEMNHLLAQIEDMLHWKLVMLINKPYLNRQTWEEGMRMMGRNASWDTLPDRVLSQQNIQDLPAGDVKKAFQKKDGGETLARHLEINGRIYWIGSVPLSDVLGRQIGDVMILHDITDTASGTQRDIYLLASIFALLSLGIMLFFRRILGNTENDLATARQKLVDEAAQREQLQAEHIQTLTQSRAALDKARIQQRLILESAGEGIYGLDADGLTTFVNPAATGMLGFEEAELIGQPMHDLLHHTRSDGSHFPKEECPIYATFRDGRTHRIEDDLFWRKDGSSLPVDYISTPMLENGKVTGAVVTFSDISKRKQAELELTTILHVQRVLDSMLNMALSRRDMKQVLSNALEVVLSIPSFALLDKGSIFLVRGDEQVLQMAVQRNLPDELLHSCGNLPFGRCLCGKAAASRKMVVADHVDSRHEITFHGMRPHGHYCLPIMSDEKLLGVLNIYVPPNHVGSESEKIYLKTVANTLGTIIDRKQRDERLHQLTHNDTLTGLPNRALFRHRLEMTLNMSQRYTDRFALMFIDLDGFKQVNDTLGHDAGDVLLRKVAERLGACMRKSDTVARLGGDEFTVIMTRITQAEQASRMAEKIIAMLNEPFLIGERQARIGCSIGIAQYPHDAEDAESLIKQADSAMYLAKKQHNSFRFYRGPGDDMHGAPEDTTATQQG